MRRVICSLFLVSSVFVIGCGRGDDGYIPVVEVQPVYVEPAPIVVVPAQPPPAVIVTSGY